MSAPSTPAEAAREYAAHYSARDLATELRLYKKLMTSHASTPQAGYSRTQIQNIVKLVVPEQELLDTQMELARVHLGSPIATDAAPIPTVPLAPELTG